MTGAVLVARVDPPRDLYGRERPDRMLRALIPVVSAFQWLSKRGERKQPSVLTVQRDLRLVVAEVMVEARDVLSFRLVHPDGLALPAWQPGSHIDLLLPSGRKRQYSLCGDPADAAAYRIAVRRIADGGGGSVEAHELTAGTPVVVQGPRNAFPFVERGPYLFLAGGIGITPILPMVRDAARRGADWRLVYTGRSRESMPFLAELAALRTTNRVEIRPDDEFGMPDPARLVESAPAGASVYCCGPVPMIDGVRRSLVGGRLHVERFSPAPVVDGRAFQIQLGVDGEVIDVAADETALTALRRERPNLPYSCQQGFCGTCEVKVLDGAVRHNGRQLSDVDGSMLVCVSRAAGDRLVLDV